MIPLQNWMDNPAKGIGQVGWVKIDELTVSAGSEPFCRLPEAALNSPVLPGCLNSGSRRGIWSKEGTLWLLFFAQQPQGAELLNLLD